MLFGHDLSPNLLKCYDKMEFSIRIRVIYNVRHGYAIHLKLGDKFLTFLTKQVIAGKTSICSTIKENLLLYCRKFSALVVVVIIYNIFITRSVSQKITALIETINFKIESLAFSDVKLP